MTPATPIRLASAMASDDGSITTMRDAGRPSSSRPCSALRPLVPKPTITVWSCTWDLQRLTR